MNWFKAISTILVGVTLSSSLAWAGKDNGGGGDVARAYGQFIKGYIENNGRQLKGDLLTYLRSVEVDKMDSASPQIKAFFADQPGVAELISDINKTRYEIKDACFEAVVGGQKQVPIATNIGEPGSTVCFDLPLLFKDLERLLTSLGKEQFKDTSEVGIVLASLVMHEHKHHYQTMSDLSQKPVLEQEADQVFSYMILTARFQTQPVMVWGAPSQVNGGSSALPAELLESSFQDSPPSMWNTALGTAVVFGAGLGAGSTIACLMPCNLAVGGAGALGGLAISPFIYAYNASTFRATTGVIAKILRSEFSVKCTPTTVTIASDKGLAGGAFVLSRVNGQGLPNLYNEKGRSVFEGVPMPLVGSYGKLAKCGDDVAAVDLRNHIKVNGLEVLKKLETQGWLPNPSDDAKYFPLGLAL